jgi:hypothetical protein
VRQCLGKESCLDPFREFNNYAWEQQVAAHPR